MSTVVETAIVNLTAQQTPKLSALVREGAKQYPEQIFGVWFKYSLQTGELCGTCTIGAAAAALGITRYKGAFQALLAGLGWTLAEQPYVAYPDYAPVWDFVLDRHHMNIFEAIGCLNDVARWSREMIADWLEGIGY